MTQMDRTHISRRQALKFMGGMAGLAVLAGCAPAAAPGTAPSTSGSGEAAAPAEAPVSLVVAHRREYFKEMEDLFAAAVQDWGAENNVEIETTTVAAEAFEDFVAKTSAAVEAGNPPNLIYHVRLVQQLYFLNALEPVTDAVEQAEALYGPAPFGQRYSNFIDGEWYGIPYIMNGSGAFGRRSKFEAVGINPETDMVTWDQRRDAALAATDAAGGFYGWGVTANRSGDGRGFLQSVIQSYGGHYTDAEMTQVTFNSPETIAAVEWLAELYTSEKYAPMLPPGIEAWTDSSNNEAYLAGSIGYTHNAASVYANAKQDYPELFEDTYVFETAIGPTGQKLEGGGGGQFNIPRGATHQDVAKQLALHLITPEVFLPISLISAGLFLPAYAGYYEMDEVKSALEADPNLARIGRAQLGDHPGDSWPAEPSPYFDAIAAQNILTDMMAEIITAGATPEQAVANAAARMEQIAEEMGAFA